MLKLINSEYSVCNIYVPPRKQPAAKHLGNSLTGTVDRYRDSQGTILILTCREKWFWDPSLFLKDRRQRRALLKHLKDHQVQWEVDLLCISRKQKGIWAGFTARSTFAQCKEKLSKTHRLLHFWKHLIGSWKKHLSRILQKGLGKTLLDPFRI